MSSSVVVAMDGPSGSGKSSTSRGVARRLGLRYLDTGAQFRAITLWMLRHDVDIHDPAAVAAQAETPVLVSGTDPAAPTITVDGDDVADPIRSAEVTAAVSPVATVPAVRTRLLELQRSIIADALAAGTGIVVEGRDIGSVVWPDAAVKLYLTADAAARAARRTAENGSGSAAATEADLLRRDAIDSSRTTAPLVVPDGAVHLDTTPYGLDEVIDRVVAIVERESVGS
ncbi:(d)CMP kinase [Nocardioides marmoriginsengisoli]|uniref:Cytidylate kinase n=1 Tax=Nocardioides marmoriginsengisoli TaxID=661483 RepID=A0A3N0CJR4_9ACTN|nr:(d)CMP kinase [Nocardioides marmoriginsengisoli]RNL63684.1 (d)CMP kinase [Nocardioides marmoriginsengisoli]